MKKSNNSSLPLGPELSRKYRVKGKSKHLFARLREEKLSNINQLRDKMMIPHHNIKKSWWQRFWKFIINLK